DLYQADGEFSSPHKGWAPISGLAIKDGRFYVWSHGKLDDGDFTVVAALTREYLANLVPNLGLIQLVVVNQAPDRSGIRIDRGADSDAGSDRLPPMSNQFDVEIHWYAAVPIEVW